MILQSQINALIEENERLKSSIKWIDWYQVPGHADRELETINSEIARLTRRREQVISHRDDTKTIPTLRERSKFIVGKILELEKREKERREEAREFVSKRESSKDRVGGLSQAKSLELAENLGMSVEDLRRMILKGCVK